MHKRTTKNTQARFTVHLGLPGFLVLALLVLVGMTWAFVLGIMVGRGYLPEQMAADIAQQVLSEDLPLITEKNEEVLKAEELEFFDKLKQLPENSTRAPQMPAPSTVPKAPEKPTAQEEAPAVKEDVFVFNYQVAALQTMEQAQIILKQLEPGGFKTSVIKASHAGKTWFRVYVHHQGSVTSAEALKENLKKYGIKGVLLRSRTPL